MTAFYPQYYCGSDTQNLDAKEGMNIPTAYKTHIPHILMFQHAVKQTMFSKE